ncbi:MAG: hypothetical protein ACKV2T_05510 [Kofleriaceae bacterium]
MLLAHRIIFVALAFVSLVGCKNKKEIHDAKHSLYNTDFAVVFTAALEATREQYSRLDDFPGQGMIKTAWHAVSSSSESRDVANQGTVSAQNVGAQSQAASAAGMPTRLAYKRTYIRFDVSVVGGRPWRVKVMGHAAEWDAGNAMPTELRGMARPPWLDGRIESLQVAIYRRIKTYAVPMPPEVEVVKDEPQMPTTDPSTFKNVPPLVAKRLAFIKDALGRRDYAALRTVVSENVVWSLGGAPGADTAMAMWQADPETLDAMAATIVGGCSTTDTKTTCPPGPPVAGAWQLELSLEGESWHISSFVRSE